MDECCYETDVSPVQRYDSVTSCREQPDTVTRRHNSHSPEAISKPCRSVGLPPSSESNGSIRAFPLLMGPISL
jgi:hypothetical protein